MLTVSLSVASLPRLGYHHCNHSWSNDSPSCKESKASTLYGASYHSQENYVSTIKKFSINYRNYIAPWHNVVLISVLIRVLILRVTIYLGMC